MTLAYYQDENGAPLMGMDGTSLNMAADVDYKRRQPHRSESPDIARIVSQSSKAKATTHGTTTDCSLGDVFGSREFLTYLTLFGVLHFASFRRGSALEVGKMCTS